MPNETTFAPYRLAPGALPEEAARAAAALDAEPLVAAPAEPLPAALLNRALADVPVGRAAESSEACRAADGSVSGMGGAPRACLSSERQRIRVADAIRSAVSAGFAGVCLDRPDAPLTLGLLGAGFCTDCQRAFTRQLVREYGDHFQPVDFLALAREAVAQASGALSFEVLPFGRDFWRSRNDALERAVADYARSARDASRARPARSTWWSSSRRSAPPSSAPRDTRTPGSSRPRSPPARPASGSSGCSAPRWGVAPSPWPRRRSPPPPVPTRGSPPSPPPVASTSRASSRPA
jgi:hypothetical protein